MRNRAVLAVLAAALALHAQTYTTNFDKTENPISEGGNWSSGGAVGLDWGDVATSSGIAHGVDCDPGVEYNDPTAILKGTWSADQTVEGTVYSVNQNSNLYQEVELRLRSTMTAHSSRGYEVFFRCLKTADAYCTIVRWNGALGDFAYLSDKSGAQYGVKNGDVVKATMIGNVITQYINGVQVAQVTDNNAFADGNPGIGFDYGTNGTYQDYGFTSFTATGSGATQTLTSIAVAPATAAVKTAATRQFTASAKDQNGAAMTPQPAFTWTVSGGGTISTAGLFTAGTTAGGPFTVTASSGGTSGTASVTVTAPTVVESARIHCVTSSFVTSTARRVITVTASGAGALRGSVVDSKGIAAASFEARAGSETAIRLRGPGVFFVRFDDGKGGTVNRMVIP